MPLVNYRAVEDRFAHIDAEFVSCRMEMPGECYYAVRFYPWWEHPLLQAATKAGQRWSFTPQSAEGRITVTVYPRGLRECRVSTHVEVDEMGFDDAHPLLWKYEDTVRVMCNSPIAAEHMVALVDLVRREAQGHVDPFSVIDVVGGLTQLLKYAAQGSFHLGTFPLSLYPKVQAYLGSVGARIYAALPTRPASPVPKILFMDDDYVVADDFDIDVPEVVHRPEWFSPA